MSSPRLALASSDGRIAVHLLNLDTGQSVPVRTPMDNGGAFHDGMARRGWVAAKVEYETGACLDGCDLRSPVLLPEAWTMFPAAADDEILLNLYHGRSALPGELTQVVVVGPDGVVRRSATLPWTVEDRVVGEVESGVVSWAGICDWDGIVRPLPVETTDDPYTDPRPVAVLGGRVIVFDGVDFAASVDTRDGSVARLDLPAQPRGGPFDVRFDSGSSVQYNSAATWLVASSGWDGSGAEDYLVCGPGGIVRWLPRRPPAASLWVGDTLLQWSFTDGHAVEYDPSTDRFMTADVAPMRLDPLLIPRVDVTGRFPWPL